MIHTTKMPEGFLAANVKMAAKIELGGGEANIDPAMAPLKHPSPTYPAKAG